MADGSARSGSTSVRIRGIAEWARRARTEALAAAESELARQVEQVVERAAQQWPVATGRSRAALQTITEARLASVRVAVRNTVAYAGQVQLAGTGGELAWEVLVVEPVTKLQRRARELAADIERRIQARVNRAR